MSAGIDIGSKSIKVVELDKQGNQWILKGSGVVGYGGVLIENAKDEKELAGIANVIKKLCREARLSAKNVAISLPERHVFTRTISFPLLTDQEIDSAVKWEAEQYIPIPLAEAVVQHQIIERKEDSSPPEVVVLLAAARQTLVEKYMQVISLAGMSVAVVESELMSLVRALATDKETAMIIDFGAVSTDIAISKNGNLVFSRSLPTAGDALTRAVSQGLGVEATQAEEYKKTYGLSSAKLEGKVGQALSPVVGVIVDEIKKALQYYQTDEKGEKPKQIIVTGGTSGLPEMVSLLTKEIGVEIIVGNPFSKVKVADAVYKQIANYAPLYSVAVGLALRGG